MACHMFEARESSNTYGKAEELGTTNKFSPDNPNVLVRFLLLTTSLVDHRGLNNFDVDERIQTVFLYPNHHKSSPWLLWVDQYKQCVK